MIPSTEDRRYVIIGQISGLFGVRGEVKVFSYTKPRQQIFSYHPWFLNLESSWVEHEYSKGNSHGKSLSALIEGFNDRDDARALIGTEIAICREQLLPLSEDNYYWSDLIQMEVYDQTGNKLGKVVEMLETGANDVLVVEGQNRMLIPFVVEQVVKKVDLKNKKIFIEWDPESS